MRGLFSVRILSLIVVSGFGCASALAEDGSEFRPAWAQGQYQQPANSSILYLNENPSFVGPDFGTRILGQKRIDQLRDDYYCRNRSYDMKQSYGIATQNDEIAHQQAMHDMGRVVLFAAKNSQAQVYGHNIAEAEKNGEVAQPFVYIGSAASLGMGTPVDLKISDSTKATWHGDAMQRHGQLDLSSHDLLATVQMSANPADSERYKISVSKPLALSLNSSVMYGGTSNTVNASLGRPIFDRLSGSVGAMLPTGSNPTGAIPQATANLSYGLTF